MAKVLKSVGEALNKLGLRAPWRFTGPASSPEYMSHLPKATEYRIRAPSTPPFRAIVPQAEDDRVYNIKYYNRDTRRAFLPGGTMKLEKSTVDPLAKAGEEGALPEPVRTAGKPYQWSGPPRSILDHDGNGYTI